jgi:6-phosphogluconolactonase (cycloisomerase 2 family)
MGGANDGALTALAGFPYDLPACSYIVADQTGVYLYAAAGTVTGFKLNAATGELSPLSTAAFTTGNTPDFLMTF